MQTKPANSVQVENAIEVKDLWEQFRIYHERSPSLKEKIVRFYKTSYEDFWALKNVTLNVKKGESIGVIGENGSGKSTLLKCIAKILPPTKGEAKANGKVSALIEIGTGFHQELTGKENVYLYAAILGFSKKEIDKRFDDIVSFAGLEQFIDTPVRSYSSGMYIRLGFAVAANVDADIILIDEVLAVGDELFQVKCIDKIEEFKNQGKTIFFVSHALGLVDKICDRCIWMENGEIKADGPTTSVIGKYQTSLAQKEEEAEDQTTESRWGSREVEYTDVSFIDSKGKKRNTFRTGESLTIQMAYNAHKKVDKPVFGVVFYCKDGTSATSSTTKSSKKKIDFVTGKGIVKYRISCLYLLPSIYDVTVYIYDYDLRRPFDHHHQVYPLKVVPGKFTEPEGVFHLDAEWEI